MNSNSKVDEIHLVDLIASLRVRGSTGDQPGTGMHPSWFDLAVSALEELGSYRSLAQSRTILVQSLKWVDMDLLGSGAQGARTPLGPYHLTYIADATDRWVLTHFGAGAGGKFPTEKAAKEAAQADFRRMAIDCFLHVPPAIEDDGDEIYELGVRDGYNNAVQDVDRITGGDGEYRLSFGVDPDRHTPDAATMKQRISDRFAALCETASQRREFCDD